MIPPKYTPPLDDYRKGLQILRKAKEIIKDRDHWTTGSLMRNKEGESYFNDEPVSFCSLGAICHAENSLNLDRGDRFDLLSEFYAVTGNESIGSYNDTHTHEEVLSMFDKVIANIEKKVAEHLPP